MSKPKTGQWLPCGQCGTRVWIIPARAASFKYCSQKCRATACHAGRLGAYSNPRTVTCHCGVQFVAAGPQPAKYCSLGCKRVVVNERRRKGSRTMPEWSLIEGRRDRTVKGKLHRRGLMNRCTECGYDAEPRILEAHHMDGDHTNNRMENLTALCPNCHALAHLNPVQ